MVVTLLALTAGVALADVIDCSTDISRACFGTDGPDTITGTNARDEIDALGGADTVDGKGGNGNIDATDGFKDSISCGTGLDKVASNCETRHPE